MSPPAHQPDIVFDAAVISLQSNIPSEFIWPDHDKPCASPPQLNVPTVDLGAFLSGDATLVAEAVRQVDEACRKHGFFLVVNHGVDAGLVARAEQEMGKFFRLSLQEKQNKAQRKIGESCGYASSFTGRFSCNLPWKETLSFRFCDGLQFSTLVQDYLSQTLGEEFTEFGRVYQEYCKEMNDVGMKIMGLLGVSLGVGEEYFKEFFSGNESIMRLNNYPPCQRPELTLGTGPHSDPTSLTILHQDQVGGLQVLVDNIWHTVAPIPQAFVINIGDTFMALSNGIYKSCLHRAVVNNESERRSMAFFVNPRADRVVRPPPGLVRSGCTPRMYPDFTWPEFLQFTQKRYRSDTNTLQVFSNWLKAPPTTPLL